MDLQLAAPPSFGTKPVQSNRPGSRSDGYTPGQIDQQGVFAPHPVAGQPGLPSPQAPGSPQPMPIAAPPVNRGPANPMLKVPTGRPADANPSQVPLAASPASPKVAPPATAASSIPLATAPGASPYATAATNVPGSATDYTNKTIAPGPGVDRLALAKSNFDNFRTAEEPYYKADIRDATQNAAGRGQIGSGMLRGRLGDIADTHDQRLQLAQSNLINGATEGSIGDSYNNIGIAQQQQGFQNQQQQQAFQQQMEQQQLEEYLRNGQFGRSATELGLGDQGNPSDIALQLSGIYGKQSGDAGQAAGSLLGNSALQKALKGQPASDAGGYNVNDPNQNIFA